MNEFKGTPGPWYEVNGCVYGPNFAGVCSLLGSTERPVPKANALLLAAAPDLLNALQSFIAQAEFHDLGGWDWEDEIELAKAAIAKALGEKP